jgi:uncharacterized protein YjdB
MASICVPPFFQASAIAYGLKTFMMNSTMLDVFSDDPVKLQTWADMNMITSDCICHHMIPRYLSTPNLLSIPTDLQEHVQNAESSSFFTVSQLRTVYSIPAPSNTPIVVGIVSFGGGLYGTVDSNGVLTNGDVQAYWSSIGIPTANQPKVIIVPLSGAKNTPNINDGGSTIENTIDVQTVGGICPTASLTIILYISPNSLSQFSVMLNYMYNTPVISNGISYKPNIVSCSWGAPEIYYPSSILTSINTVMTAMTDAGINICVATGDNGSNDGVGGSTNYVDFPSSNPNSIAVGGTSLICPNRIYDSETIETAWTSGGGGISVMYPKPSYQSFLTCSGRSTPDVAMVADPNTGVLFTINGQTHSIGGTSVAAPIMAGFLAAINCRTFVTPLLYRAPLNCFHEIMFGSNGGYVAEAGYDNVTGWGSIHGTILSSFLAQPTPSTIPVSSIILYPTPLSLMTGQTSPFSMTVLPANATNPLIHLSSSNPSIAYVNNQQIVAVSPGTAQIIALSDDGSNVSSTITVNVSPVLVTSITLNPMYISLSPTQTATVTASVLPANAYNPSIRWASTDTAIATVVNGLVTAVRVGTVTIQAQSVDGSSIMASLTITVRAAVIEVTSIGLSQTNASMLPQSTVQLNTTYLPIHATETTTTWSSNNGNATVTQYGLITAITPGTSVITARTGSVTASCIVTIIIPVTSISISPSTTLLSVGNSKVVTTTILPANAGGKVISWTSANATIASVSSTGMIKGISEGTTTITAQCQSKTATLTVTVSVPIQMITLNTMNIALNRGSTYMPNVTIQPSNANQSLITWKSMMPNIATVNADGLITAVSNGTSMITAIAQNGSKTASMIVRVLTSVSSITLNESGISVRINTTSQLNATLSPQGVSNPIITWSSSQPAIASVTNNGLVRGVMRGNAMITAITANGSLMARCTVSVI